MSRDIMDIRYMTDSSSKICCGLRSLLFWDVTQSRVAVSYRRFGTTYLPHLQCSLEVGTDRLPEKLVNTNLRCVTSQKSEDFIYTAAEA